MPTRRARPPAASRKPYRARAFVVLGMHRSGTSAFAGVLQHLGVDFGDKLLPGRPGENPRGFWEHAEVVRIHDDLLSGLGSSWDDPRLLPANWTGSSAAQQATRDLLDVARADFGAHATWGLKDPRLCRLLPLWIPIFEKVRTEPVFIVAWRNPMDVAASLFERDGFALRKSLILWLVHVTEAEKSSRAHRRAFLSYDRLLADWPDAFASAASRLRLSWPRRLEDARADIEEFLEPSLRHHRSSEPTRGNALGWGRWISEWCELLTEMEAGGGGRRAAALASQFEKALEVLGPQLSFDSQDAEVAQVFYPVDGLYEESRSITARFGTNRWQRLKMLLPARTWPAGTTLRLDPCNSRGFVTIVNLTLSTAAASPDVLFRADSAESLAGLTVGGTAERLPARDALVLRSFGGDPHVFVPIPRLHEGGLVLEVQLKVEESRALDSYLAQVGRGEVEAPVAPSADVADEALVTELRQSLARKEAAVRTLEKSLYREEQLAEGARDSLAELSRALREQESQIAQLWNRNEAMAREAAARAEAVAAAERAAAVAERAAAVAERAAAVAERERDEAREQAREEAEALRSEMVGLRQALSDKAVALDREHRVAEEVHARLEGVIAENATIKASAFWALRLRIQRLRLRIAPVGTRRARAAHLAASAVRLGASEGMGPFLRRTGQRVGLLRGGDRRSTPRPTGDRREGARSSWTWDRRGARIRYAVRRFLANLPMPAGMRPKARRFAHRHIAFLFAAGGAPLGPPPIEMAPAFEPAESALPDGPRPRGGAALADDVARLDFMNHVEPVVSVVIPVYNNATYTVACLKSLCRHRPERPFEVIVVDDGSADETRALLSRVPNLKYVRNERNLGFLRSANRGAMMARGKYLMFLNNDTEVTPGWLDRLVDLLLERPHAGIVGSKLVYPSGHLQEAGALVRSDGQTELVGLNDDPERPQYNVVREVDYCSGASLMIPRDVFARLGGLDERYVPAYFEDCDLALRVRALGLKVLYQPGSVVVHHLSATTAKVDSGEKMHQIEVNREKLLDRWQPEIERLERVRAIAFYLPQFHPIPENDRWWGKGFTEWTNVGAARPLYPGHAQPRIPADLGFYDLRLPEVREAQAHLAAQYGVTGFCYYYYWFGGKRLLNRPLDEVLRSREPRRPFCVCWANENWTRRWDGRDADILIAQNYSPEDDRRFMEELLPCLGDDRYIRIGGRPLLLVYRTSLLPEPERTAEIWRQVCRRAGVGEPYLASIQSFEGHAFDDPRRYGFDAAVEFPPHGLASLDQAPKGTDPAFRGLFFDYLGTARNFMRRELPPYTLFRTAMPSWDNTPRLRLLSHIFLNSSPETYGEWLQAIVTQTRQLRFGDERIVFINAWNEWAEGNCLEPDQQHGHAYLEATGRALKTLARARARCDR